jgi:hypothetical protein
MLKKYFLLLTISFFASPIFAQITTISGTIFDTSSATGIRHASISVLSTDSMLQTFTRSALDGTFSLNINKPGNYTLLVGHPSYADYRDKIQANGSAIVLPKISLTNRAKLLQEVVIRQKGAIRIKGDTTVYLADSFKVDDNANVEELLKLLPGVEVDKDGKITTQGEQVQKILVDGEEFFGDDPTVATRNLAAKVIDKVEVFDSKSEQAKFTGFDDGTKEKTINLKMKDNMNHGVFGKVRGAIGTKPASSLAKNLYDNAGMVNAFKNKRKLSAYAINSSTGTTGLNWNDQSKFGEGDQNVMFEEDGGITRWSSGDGEGDYDGEGFPKVNNAGVQYSNKWLDGKHELNLSSSVKNNTIVKAENSNSTNYVGSNAIGTLDTSSSNVQRNKISGRAKYEWQLDTTATIILNLGGNTGNAETKQTYNSINTNNDDFASASAGSRNTNNKSNASNADITWKKKLQKIGRTISINAGGSMNNKNAGTYILGQNTFGTVAQTINQFRDGNSISNSLNARVVYTEPLMKEKLQAEISYAGSRNYSSNQQITKVQSVPNQQYDTQIDSLSNDFESTVIGNGLGIKFKYKLKKVNITVGNTFRYSVFDQQDKIRNLNYDYSRFNLFPNVNFNYKISQFSNLRIDYNGNTRQPTVNQLQNVYDNTDPLNIVIGNPNLKQSYNQNINVNYWNYKAFSDRSMWGGLYGGNTFNNMIGTIQFESATGRTINSYANVQGTYNFGMYAGYNAKIPKTDFKYSINLNGNLGRRPTIVNTAEQVNKSGNWSLEPSISYRKAKVFEASVGYNVEQNFYINKAVPANNTAYFVHTPEASATWYISKRAKMGSDVEYVNRQAVAPFTTNFNRTIFNSFFTYKFLKQKNLEATLAANDILNQNKGNERNVYGNTISERNFLTIGRNFLVSLTYNFSHGPVNKLPKDEDENDF